MHINKFGFTIIELLVVIAVISIISSIVFPVYSKCREKARMSSCSNNLHQLGLAFAMYTQDNDQQRPESMQDLWDSGVIKDKRILICPDDESGNWGGIIFENSRNSMYPEISPQTIRYSYIYAFTVESQPDTVWKELIAVDSNPGIMACQLHGDPDPIFSTDSASEFNYSGRIMRLRSDGSIVTRFVPWERTGKSIATDEWKLFTDSPPPTGH